MSPPEDAERVTSIWYVCPETTPATVHDTEPPEGIVRFGLDHDAPPLFVQPASPSPPAGHRSGPKVAPGTACTRIGAVMVLTPVIVCAVPSVTPTAPDALVAARVAESAADVALLAAADAEAAALVADVDAAEAEPAALVADVLAAAAAVADPCAAPEARYGSPVAGSIRTTPP